MTNLKPVDVAIIGGGWTGLLMAKEITAKTSQSVAVFERGIPRKTADYAVTMDELDHNIRLRMMQNTAEETITHRHSLKDSAVPVRQHGSFHPGTGVGGAGEHWGGASFRFLPDLFTLRTHLTQKHGAAKLPADLAVQDWGVTYDELEPLLLEIRTVDGHQRQSRQSARPEDRWRQRLRRAAPAGVSDAAAEALLREQHV